MESINDNLISELENIAKSGHKKYSVDFKLKVIKFYHLNLSIHLLSNKLNIDRKVIRDWINKEADLLNVKNNKNKYRCNKKSGIIRNFSDEEENFISEWIASNRAKKIPVSTKSLISYAGSINQDFSNKPINIKLRWAYRYLKRKGFSIRRVSHIGQFIPQGKDTIKNKFVHDLILKRKEINIAPDEDFKVINMDETPCYLEMGFDTTIDFVANKNVEIETTGRSHYRVTVILSIVGDGTKLPPLIILKGEPGKYIETTLKKLDYVKNKNMFILCQPDGWCTTSIFQEWIKNIYIPYQNYIMEKCLLVLDMATSHISKEALNYLNNAGISYIIIPAGMTPYCQPLDVAVNKIFKDNIKLLFEKDRLLLDNINPKIKLNTLRVNLLGYINNVWNDDSLITKNIIINGFIKSGIVGNNYLSLEEQKVRDCFLYDLNISDNLEIIDDISYELNIDICSNEEEENEELDSLEEKEKDNINIPEDYKSEIEKLDNTFKNQNDDLMDLD